MWCGAPMLIGVRIKIGMIDVAVAPKRLDRDNPD